MVTKMWRLQKCFVQHRSYMRHAMNTIQSKDHNIGSYRINKISLPS